MRKKLDCLAKMRCNYHLLVFTFLLLALESSASWPWGCSFIEFTCDDGECISSFKKCDGTIDCSDGSDEKNCKTASTVVTSDFDETTPITSSHVSATPYHIRGDIEELEVTEDPFALTTLQDIDLDESSPPPRLVVEPESQNVAEGGDVTLQCRDEGDGRYKVIWTRGTCNWSMPDNARQVHNGRLDIEGIRSEQGGDYVCTAIGAPAYSYSKVSVVKVISKPWNRNPRQVNSLPPPTPGHSINGLATTANPCTTTACDCSNATKGYYICKDGGIILAGKRCNKENDCNDGSDEANCPTATPPISISPPLPTIPEPSAGCKADEFRCNNGDCIPNRKFCDGEMDCTDGSDETTTCDKLWAPKITKLPKSNVELDCVDPSREKSSSLQLDCEFVGSPMPIIKWKKNEGTAPSKCFERSLQGRGTLICPNFTNSDQGAYSCVGQNSMGAAESQPKSVVKCKNAFCNSRSFKVKQNQEIEHCLLCYCSGRSDNCRATHTDRAEAPISFSKNILHEVFVSKTGQVTFIPSDKEFQPPSTVRDKSEEVTYCSAPKNLFHDPSFVKAYGRSLHVPAYTGKVTFNPEAPDVIIRGNGLALTHKYDKHDFTPENEVIRLWPDHWKKLNQDSASRHDIMRVLSRLDTLLMRCEYQQGTIIDVESGKLEYGISSNKDKTISFVEDCACPDGYVGRSCEKCAPGFHRKDESENSLDECIRNLVPCKEGYTGNDCEQCDSTKGYKPHPDLGCARTECNVAGTVDPLDSSGICRCKELVTGEHCDTCKAGSYFLHLSNALGCKPCWCSGVSQECVSSTLYRTPLVSTSLGGHNTSEGTSFWLLNDFRGNLLTSYGGYLNYSIFYKPNLPKQTEPLTVEILSVYNQTLTFEHPDVDDSVDSQTKFFRVLLEESKWRNLEKTPVDRGQLLTVLSHVRAIYIQSPYHLSSGHANLSSVSLERADKDSFGSRGFASEVEVCVCPEGYSGLSCEDCADGFFRNRKTNPPTCVPCDCPFSGECDKERGCLGCKKGEYFDGVDEFGASVCPLCPCNNNERSCEKDDLGRVTCDCNAGWTGEKCETAVIDDNKTQLKVTISPNKVKDKKFGTKITFTCTYDSSEEMRIEFKKVYEKKTEGPENGIEHNDDMQKSNQYGSMRSLDVVLDSSLKHVVCLVYNMVGMEVGNVMAVIETMIVQIVPPEIKDCSNLIEAIEGDDVELPCYAIGTPTPAVQWFRVKGSSSERVETVDGIHAIQSASLSMNGTVYQCVANNEGGDSKCNVQLIVKELCLTIDLLVTPEYLEIEEGEDISLHCEGSRGERVDWTRESGFLSPRAHTSGGTLKIAAAKSSDGGAYICESRNVHGYSNKTARVVVNLKKIPPTAQILEGDTELQEGSDFQINCNVTGQPTPTITWTKRGRSMPSNVVVHDSRLSLRSATLENQGVYECKAESIAGNASSRINIKIIQYVKPTISITPFSVQAKEGERISIVCRSSGKPRPSLTWKRTLKSDFISRRVRNGSNIYELNQIQPYGFPSTGLLESFNELVITEAQLSDAGQYSCVADSPAGTAEANIRVEVIKWRIPRITIHPLKTPIEGEDVNAICEAIEGEPSPRLEWSRIGSGYMRAQDFGTGVLRFNGIKESDSGKYLCTGSNSAGTTEEEINIDVYTRPKVRINGEYTEVNLDGNLTIECWARGHPQPEIRLVYLRNRQERVILAPEKSFHRKISILAESTHSGRYTCIAKNDVGQDQQSKHVNVILTPTPPGSTRGPLQPKTPYTESLITIEIGGRVTLKCEGVLEKVNWTKVNGLLQGDECKVGNDLLIKSVQIQHTGRYRCTSLEDPGRIHTIMVRVTSFIPRFAEKKSFVLLPSTATGMAFTIEVTFTAEGYPGVILMMKKSDLEFSIYLREDKRLFVYMHPGGGVSSDRDLDLNVTYTARVTFTGGKIFLSIFDEKGKLHGEKEEADWKGTLQSAFSTESFKHIYLGGTNITKSNYLKNRVRPVRPGGNGKLLAFHGCITRLIVDGSEYVILRKALYSREVTACNRCRPSPCGEAGVCFEAPTQFGYVCTCRNGNIDKASSTCPPGCVGDFCPRQETNLCDLVDPCRQKEGHTCTSTASSLHCGCTQGYKGVTCGQVEEFAFRVKSDGYIKLLHSRFQHNIYEEDRIEMEFTPDNLNGLLLWQGDQNDQIYLTMINGLLRFVYNNQHSLLTIDADEPCRQNQKNSVLVTRSNNTVSLTVNGNKYELVGQEDPKTNRVIGDVYIGGPPSIVQRTHNGFSGCIHYVILGSDRTKINIRDKEVERVNSDSCQSNLPLQNIGNDSENDISKDDQDNDYIDY